MGRETRDPVAIAACILTSSDVVTRNSLKFQGQMQTGRTAMNTPLYTTYMEYTACLGICPNARLYVVLGI